MVKVLRVKKELAQTAKEFLMQKGWLATNIVIGKSAQRYVLLPLNEKVDESILLKKFEKSSIENRNLKPQAPVPGNLKHLLQHLIPKEEISKLIRSYDTVGDICILEIPKELEKFELTIGHAIKRAFPNIKVVAKKTGTRTEIERVQPLKIITGEHRFTTTHKEYGVLMKVDLGKVYFSPRASGERFRIAQLVKKGEKVLVMFGGVAPYALIIAKVQPNCKIWSIELNPAAHKLAEENVRINRMGHIITALQGDVRDILPKIGERFDRIVMPFPEKSWDFLELALKYTLPNATIHFMAFVHEDEIQKAVKRIEEIAKNVNKKIIIKNWRPFGTYAPRINRYTFDILVE
ncbi:MAG: class I SAM-dependent methyltransferase family protein [Candidatus Nanoarchaeia archaeon]